MADGRIAFQPSDSTFAFVDPSTGKKSAPLTPGGGIARVWAAGDDLLVLTFDGNLTMRSASDARVIDTGVIAAIWINEAVG